MSGYIEQILSVLNTDTGHLAYNLVLAFSLAGALFFAIISAQRVDASRNPAAQRLILGLSLLLGLRVILFIVSGLVWQNVIDGSIWLPLIDRAVTLLSLVLIIWLWAFPDPAPDGDAAAILISFLIISVAIFGGVWWADQAAASLSVSELVAGAPTDMPSDTASASSAAFNASTANLGSQIAALVLVLFGALTLFARRPDGWGIGLVMLLVLGLGHAVQLFLPPTGDYPLAVRLAQMIAFPFLVLLAQRYPSGGLMRADSISEPVQVSQPQAEESRRFNAAQVLLALQDLPASGDPRLTCQRIAVAITRVMDADLCLLIMPPDTDGRLAFKCGYDRSHGRHLDVAMLKDGDVLEEGALAARDVPMLASALRLGRTRSMSGASNLPDMVALARLLKLDRTGDLLYIPALTSAGDAKLAIVLLNPYSDRGWTHEEQAFLATMASYLVPFLQRSQEMADMKEELEQRRKSARSAQDKAHQALLEGQKLRDQLAVLQDDLRRDRDKLTSLAVTAAAGAAAQESLSRLQAQNEELQQALQQAEQNVIIQPQDDNLAAGELRMALEEVSHLRNALQEADRQMTTLKASLSDIKLSNDQMVSIVAVAQDLRQPLSSIIGYTDFLLSEVIGILGAKQRKYLERIHISTERMSRLVDDLMLAVSLEGNLSSMNIEEVDLCTVLRKAASQNSPYLTEKNIDLQMELPDQAMLVNADQNALRRVFSLLLRNASLVTPDGGDVNLSARLEASETDQEYMLIQVVDSGQGIASQDLPRVFSTSSIDGPIAGLGINGDELPDVKALIEVLGGRIWVDSELGQGATFSVLLPVSQPGFEAALG